MSNLTGVTNFFSTANEGFSTTLASTIASGAGTVPLSNMSSLTDGTVFVGIIEPGGINQQTFTGVVNQASTAITGVIWTRGTNVPHVGGVTVVDYVTGTDFNMMSTGILKQHTQAGAHKGITNTGGLTNAGGLTTDTLHATGATTLDGAISGAGYSTATIYNPYKFHAYRNAAYTTSGTAVIPLDTKLFDTNNNFNTSTGQYTVPVTGFYFFSANISWAMTGNNSSVGFGCAIQKNGGPCIDGNLGVNMYIDNQSLNFTASGLTPASAGDTIGVVDPYGSGRPLGVGGFQKNFLQGFLVSAT